MGWPKISVITPSFNQGQFLEQTMLSVLNQDYPNLEYVIIDGGSTDNSVDIIKRYENRLTYWVSERDKGQSDALNKGFKLATGDLIGWLNSDDLYVKNSLFNMAKAFKKFPDVDLIYGNNYNIDEKSNIIKVSYALPYIPLVYKLGGLFFCQPASFFKESVFNKVGYLNERIHYSMDIDFFYRMLKCGSKFKHINEFIAKFRYHSESKAIAGKKATNQSSLEHWSKYYGTRFMAINRFIFCINRFLFRGFRFANNARCLMFNSYPKLSVDK